MHTHGGAPRKPGWLAGQDPTREHERERERCRLFIHADTQPYGAKGVKERRQAAVHHGMYEYMSRLAYGWSCLASPMSPSWPI